MSTRDTEDAISILARPRMEEWIKNCLRQEYTNPFKPNSANMPALKSVTRKF
jgi:hypothetical protein